jgi:signal transduction histidine kinase
VSGVALDERRLRSLIEVGRSVVAELDLEAVLKRVVEVARELTGARYAALGVVNDDRTGLERFITAGIDERTRAEIGDLPQGRGVLGLLIDDPRPLRLDDVSRHPRSYGFPRGHPPMRGFLGVPIVIRGRAYGNLYLTEKQGGAFDEADEQATVILAEWAAIAIDNAKSVAEDRLRGSIEASERERGRWARELHDETLQALGALRVLLSAALRQGSPETIESAARKAVSELGAEIEGLRGLIAELRPAALDEIGLVAALQGLVDRISATEGLAIDAELSMIDRDEQGKRLDPAVESTIYRLVQEALTNVAKHSRAENVRLRAVMVNGVIEVSVEDDGVGFDPKAPHVGFGLPGMHERVAMAGGTLGITSSPGAGAAVRAAIPVEAKPSAPPSTASA